MTPPLWLAGSATVIALVGLGIFVYPRWLHGMRGRALVVLCTFALALLFFWLDGGRTAQPQLRAALAMLWALGPVLAGWVVARLSARGP